MRTGSLAVVIGLSASLALTGCDQVKKLAGGKPAGQVVATVNGQEITALELRQEMAGFGSRDPAVMKAAQQQAIQQIIMRKLLAQEAKEQKLDKSAEYNLQVKRGEEALLAQMYQRKLAEATKAPTKQDAEAYVAAHPEQFANRRVLVVQQVIARPTNLDVERFKPLKTLEDIKALFVSENVPFQENVATLDTLTADPRLVQQVNNLPAGEVFVLPQRTGLVFNRVTSSEATPFTGDLATTYAINAMRTQSAQELVRKKMEAIRKAAEASIVYNPAYKPPAKTAAAKPAAPAPAPAAAAAPASAAPATDAATPPAK